MNDRIRHVGLIATGLLFTTSVLHLAQPPSGSTDQRISAPAAGHRDAMDAGGFAGPWRGAALGSLYLFCCLQARRRPSPTA
ncbi:hypothetical protein DVJ77_07585 [Dyella tabacisoli]|uniref:Uncharacterized protein n=1 Tax=Dyella tabacisoli TaxID=2282381 RepID=A0A369UQE8_9GAMM|nr:hypothetical protein DVJ77_07585 [Dyella tabacisoli]